MTTNAVAGTGVVSSTGTQVARSSGGLGKSDFLRLLTEELRHQDPLNPASDKKMMAQLAQFSSLEETTAMRTSLDKVASGQSMAQGAALIGKKVVGTVPGAYDAYGKLQPGKDVSGVVTSVAFADGHTTLNIGNQAIPMDYVTGIEPGN